MRKGLKAQAAQADKVASNYPRKGEAGVLIGIDPGTHTGLAFWDRSKREFTRLGSFTIYQAIKAIEDIQATGVKIFVRIEDATKRKWFEQSGRERLKGAGSIERDCAIWLEIFNQLDIPFETVAPKDIRPPNATFFNRFTGYAGRTNEHSRVAGWLVFDH